MASRLFQIDRDNPHWQDVQLRMNQHIVAETQAGRVLRVTVGEPKRTLAENAMLHSLLGELADQVEWAGKKRDIETWKRMLVAAWCRERGEPVEILPAIDGHGVDIVPVRTSRLSKKDCAELIEFVIWWGAEHGVKFSEVEK